MQVSRQAVDKHLRALQHAGVLTSARAGRQVLWRVRPEQLQQSAAWLSALAERWDRRLADVKALAEAVTVEGVDPEAVEETSAR